MPFFSTGLMGATCAQNTATGNVKRQFNVFKVKRCDVIEPSSIANISR